MALTTSDAIGNHVIHHPTTSGNVAYAGLGKQCPYCKCFFTTSHDYGFHEREGCLNNLGWAKSKFGDNAEICSIDKAPSLAKLLQNHAGLHIGSYNYTLAENKKWIKRTPINNPQLF